jgi:hypothetical protein
MFKRKKTQGDTVTTIAQPNLAQEATGYEALRPETAETQSAWNSWGERNPLTLGSFGRW